MRAYVQVGGPLNPGLNAVPVCVDLIMEVGWSGCFCAGAQGILDVLVMPMLTLVAGSLGAPENILGGSEEVEGLTDVGMRTYRVVDIQHILAAKLAAFRARGSPDSNDFKDLLWILFSGTYAAEVREVSGSLSPEDKQVFLAAALRSTPKLSAGRIQRIKQLLRMA